MMQAYNVQSSKGFTLIELIISVAIGVFLIAGVFSVYVNGLSSQRAVDDQVALIDNARFVIETISADLRQAGVFGRTRDYTRIEGNNFNVAGECENGWTVNATRPIFAYDETSPYAASCTSQYMPSDPLVGGSDVIEMRYSLREPVALGNLQANKVYVSANVNATEFFTGLNTPGLGADYPYVARLYYLSNHTDSPGDGIEALHRVSLGSGPVVTDEVLLSGVEELHIQLGLSSAAPAGGTDNGIVTSYVDPTNAVDWTRVQSVQLWVVVRSLENYPDIDTSMTATLPTGTRTFPNDGFRRVVMSAVVNLRNI